MNVLFILTDQQQRCTMAAYGNDTVVTPNLDRLAAQSVVFEHAVCPQPLCVPSRCSIFSGVYPHTHGVPHNYSPLPRRFPTLGDMVIDQGVCTGYLGKWHLGREVLPQRGFEEFFRAVDDTYTSARDFPLYGLSGYGRWLVEKGYEPDGSDGRFTRGFTARLPEAHTKPVYIAEQACYFLEHRREVPFLLVCSFLEPHNPYHSPYDDLHDPNDLSLPDNVHQDPIEHQPTRTTRFQEWARDIPHEDNISYDTEEKWRALTARYYGLCHHLDNNVGTILDKLDELDLADDTLVIFTSDHGDMMGAHGIYMKSMMHEESAGVPLLIRWPGQASGRIAEPVNLIDLVPTILDAFDLEPPCRLPGKSLKPLLTGERYEDPDAVAVCEWNGAIQHMFSRHELFADVKDQYIRSIRTRRWKLNLHVGDRSELYDLENDPGEMHNLIAQADHRPIIDDLYRRLLAWQRETDDDLSLPHPCTSQEPPHA